MHSPATVMASEFSRLSLVKVKAASERGGRGFEVNLNVVNMAVGASQAGLSVSQTADRLGFYNIQAFVVFTKGKKRTNSMNGSSGEENVLLMSGVSGEGNSNCNYNTHHVQPRCTRHFLRYQAPAVCTE